MTFMQWLDELQVRAYVVGYLGRAFQAAHTQRSLAWLKWVK